ncbi:RNA polymerase sigma factor SigF [Nocardia sp. NBC_01730]|uniref:RNA polymerase sigma factor SigF n=1 Tax=Nocardia sp. NBC_01730 TaxID=2975998 RepID=UPI002E137559|nr:RNA polymerase sigma factor SigF [Nocardia sp. NBC_01730]
MSESAAWKRQSPHRPCPGETYDDIEPWFEKLSTLEADDSHRRLVRDDIIGMCLPLADHIAHRFSGRGEPVDDLLQSARLGLVHAVDRFDVSLGAPFLGFAIPTIMGEVRRHFRDHTWAVQVPRRAKEVQALIGPATEMLSHRLGHVPTAREIAAELDLDLDEVTRAFIARNAYQANSFDAVFGDEEDDTPPSVLDRLGADEPCYRLMEDAMAVRPLIAALPDRERRVLIWRFFESKTQSQIAELLGVSQMQISRILSRTLAMLRQQVSAEPARRPTAVA